VPKGGSRSHEMDQRGSPRKRIASSNLPSRNNRSTFLSIGLGILRLPAIPLSCSDAHNNDECWSRTASCSAPKKRDSYFDDEFDDGLVGYEGQLESIEALLADAVVLCRVLPSSRPTRELDERCEAQQPIRRADAP